MSSAPSDQSSQSSKPSGNEQRAVGERVIDEIFGGGLKRFIQSLK
jgi:hypothetical protein